MPGIRKKKTKQVNAWVTDDVKDALAALAEEHTRITGHDVTQSDLVRIAVHRYLQEQLHEKNIGPIHTNRVSLAAEGDQEDKNA